MKKTTIHTILAMLLPFALSAQDGGGNDFFSNIGKIYVVVGVLMILFITMIGFLVYLERKVAALEQETKD